MTKGKLARLLRVLLTVGAVAFSLCLHVLAQSETTIFSFTSPGPRYPFAGFIPDASGNLYGTTGSGGSSPSSGCGQPAGCGTVFELSPSNNGWIQTVLYSFKGGADGITPAAELVFDAQGNLYGTTAGTGKTGNTLHPGTVFELSHTSNGWIHQVLHEFTGGKDGYLPTGALILDAAGNLYGTTSYGGDASCDGPPLPPGCGVVFKLERTSAGGWAEIVLHTFTGNDGLHPLSGLIWDKTGNLYGETWAGGNLNDCGVGSGCGAVYRLSPALAGGWKLTPIHKFNSEDGFTPGGTLVFGASGALYGTTGGSNPDFGLVFQLVPTSKGGWEENVIHRFTGGTDGSGPNSLILGPDGVLYGTTSQGGDPKGCAFSSCGAVFAVTHTSDGWSERILHAFSFPDGASPNGVVFSGGNLYGTTIRGGSGALGAVFEITP